MNHKPSTINHSSSGFSLVEVTLAIFMVGLGITTLFALFPAGLRQSDNAMKDTHLGLFADRVFSGIRAESSLISDWSDWADIDSFRKLAVWPVQIEGHNMRGDNTSQTVTDAISEGVHISYRLNVDEVSGSPDLRRAVLRANIGGAYDDDDAQWFYTEFFFMGVE